MSGSKTQIAQERPADAGILPGREVRKNRLGVALSVGGSSIRGEARVVEAICGQGIPAAKGRTILDLDRNRMPLNCYARKVRSFRQQFLKGGLIGQDHARPAGRDPGGDVWWADVIAADTRVGEAGGIQG